MSDAHLITSPCIHVCRLNEKEVCLGCYRTALEIHKWAKYTPQERQKIMDQLPQREAADDDPFDLG